jgi:signal transduction histidine kinase
LFFAGPLTVILSQAAANLAVQVVNRRLPPVKTAFNISQFALQTGVAIVVFRLMVGSGNEFGPRAWIAASIAVLVALALADVLINLAIRLTGGDLNLRQMIEVFVLTALAALMNTSLALTATSVLANDPGAAWLAVVPPVVLFFAYRAYVSQRQEGSRLESLYEATRALHRSPQIEAALIASAEQATKLLDAEFCEVVLFPYNPGEKPFLTAVGPGDRRIVLEPADFDLEAGIWPAIRAGTSNLLESDVEAALVRPHALDASIREAVVAPLLGTEHAVGAIIVANRLGDVSVFDADDVKLLEALARQISVSLENGRLEDSLVQLTVLKEQLEALVQSKDQFVATVSHELRTPLTAIFGMSHELQARRDTFSGRELDEMVNVITNQSIELSNMIDDLLVAAQSDVGTVNLSIEAIDVAHELRDVVEIHAQNASSNLTMETANDLPPAWADPLRFRQVLRNLLTNTERYGGRRVWVEAAVTDGVITVKVADNGKGVPPGSEEVIFEPYMSAHHAGSQPASVGLGLSVSRKLTQLMGGELRYRRDAGRTVFELTLRAATELSG